MQFKYRCAKLTELWTEAQRIQGAMTDLGLPNEYWAYAILFRVCNDVMHARIRQFSADNPIPAMYANQAATKPDAGVEKYISRSLTKAGLRDLRRYLQTLTDDDIGFYHLYAMLNTLNELEKLL